MAEWQWVLKAAALALHDEQLAAHGGPAGVRDEDLLDRALDRPRSRAVHKDSDAARLAATYAFGIARIRPFAEGNKRTAALVALLFLSINRIEHTIGAADLAVMIQSLAADELTEDEVAVWFRLRLA